MKKISCIIPAYNEEQGIEGVLSVVGPLVSKYFCEAIIIDDGSTDRTLEIAEKFPEFKLLKHEKNMGKSRTVADGIMASEGDYILMLDADLKSIIEKNIVDLIEPIKNGKADLCIAFIKNSWPLFPFKKIDYLCGIRLLPKSILLEKIEEMSKLRGYGLEVFINKIIIEKKLRLKIVKCPEIENVFQPTKYGKWKGFWAAFRVWRQVIGTVGFFGMYIQNLKLLKLLIKD
jgi:glycosyltransferase involved in cell wall biosynthesis